MSDAGWQSVLQGYFGEALVASIAVGAGLEVMTPGLGKGIDLSVYSPGPRGTSSSRLICLQVKSWAAGSLNDDGTFHYRLENTAYNYLSGTDHSVRHYLALCLVPDDPGLYAVADHDRLTLMRAAYWYSLRDRQPNTELPEQGRTTVRVPRTNLLTVSTMRALVDGNEAGAEPVKLFETLSHSFCMVASRDGSLIQATVGSLGGVGRR